MNEKHKHQFAIDLLRGELCKIGGEIFAETFEREVLKIQAEKGNKDVQEELNMIDFLSKLLRNEVLEDDKTAQFHSLLKSILVLSKDK